MNALPVDVRTALDNSHLVQNLPPRMEIARSQQSRRDSTSPAKARRSHSSYRAGSVHVNELLVHTSTSCSSTLNEKEVNPSARKICSELVDEDEMAGIYY